MHKELQFVQTPGTDPHFITCYCKAEFSEIGKGQSKVIDEQNLPISRGTRTLCANNGHSVSWAF